MHAMACLSTRGGVSKCLIYCAVLQDLVSSFVRSKGTKTAEEYHAGQCITNVRLVLTPCKEVKEALKKVKFRKVYYTKKGTPGPEPPTP